MKIYVKTLHDGTTMTLKAETSDTIEDIKVKIYEKCEIRPKQQRLIHAGRLLEDGCTLEFSNITKESFIHLALCLCGSGEDH